MGRLSTGVKTYKELNRIELKELLKDRWLVRGKYIKGLMKWSNKASIQIESYYIDSEVYLVLTYTDSQSREHRYKVRLVSIKSNLGKGKVLYFECPISNKMCRILYLCSIRQIFVSREALVSKVYYHSQICSKYDYFNVKYWHILNYLNALNKIATKKHYRGSKTKIQIKIEHLKNVLEYCEEQRLLVMSRIYTKLQTINK